MDLSIFLAKLWGLGIIILCSSLLLHYKNLKKTIKDFNDDIMILYGGIIALGIGIPSILAHNYWAFDWRVVITIIGWATFAKGVVLLVFPGSTKTIANVLASSKLYEIVLTVYLLIGVFLAYQGFTL